MKFQLTDNKPVVLSLGELLTPSQLQSAIAIPETHPLWRAFMQILWEYREEASSQASGYARENNSLAMSAAHGGHEVLTTILQELEKKRRDAYGRSNS